MFGPGDDRLQTPRPRRAEDTGKRKLPSYNQQSAVDGKFAVTCAVATTQAGDKPGDLFAMVDMAKENAGGTFDAVLADSGFSDYETLRVIQPNSEARLIPERAGKGALYPVDGGMIAAIKSWNVPAQVKFMSFSGIEEIERALDDLEDALAQGELQEPLFLELLACPGGCVNGPRTKKRTGTIRKRLSVLEYGQNRLAGSVAQNLTDTATVLYQQWTTKPVTPGPYKEQELAEALRRTGKYSREDELNCGGCGYDTCRDFAKAMLAGKAEPDMCVSYMRKLAQKKANGLIRAIPSGVVIVDARLTIVECNQNFARILGEEALQLWEAKPGLEGASLEKLLPFYHYFQDVLDGSEAIDRDIRFNKQILHATIFGIERGAYAGGVFQDVTAPWVQKDRVVSQARKVITRNLAVVQKIAFLLGENAAETETTLNSIIESFEKSESLHQDKGRTS